MIADLEDREKAVQDEEENEKDEEEAGESLSNSRTNHNKPVVMATVVIKWSSSFSAVKLRFPPNVC